MPYIIYTCTYLPVISQFISKKICLSVGVCHVSWRWNGKNCLKDQISWHTGMRKQQAITLHGISLVISWEISLWNITGHNQPAWYYIYEIYAIKIKESKTKTTCFPTSWGSARFPPSLNLVFISDQKPMPSLVEQKLKPQILTKGRMIRNIPKQPS